MAAKKKCPECVEGAPAWMVTFGDLMSLLLTFFVLLLSFATMEQPREFEEAIVSIKGAFGILPSNITVVQINPQPVRMKRLPQKAEEAAREIAREIQVDGKSEDVVVEYDETGALKLNLPTRVLYDAGAADLREDAYPFLSSLAQIMSRYPDAFFEVHGHTDNTNLSDTSIFRDNWDLSYARADAVMRFLAESGGISRENFESVAHGSGDPIQPNTTQDGRDANRRVELFIRGLLTDQEVNELKEQADLLVDL